MADADSSQSSRRCRACACPIARYKQLCRACFVSRRTASQRQWPSRITACQLCGKRRRTRRAICSNCAHAPSTVRCQCGNTFTPWLRNDGTQRAHPAKTCGHCPPKPPKPPKAPVLYTHQCAWCHNSFSSSWPTQKSCSVACRKRLITARKHLRRRGLRRKQRCVSLPYIYQRDKGKCGLCGRVVRRRLHAPHSDAPTLDHIIPVSAGGQHTPENIQLAHYGCNSRKGTKPCGSQLRLIG